MEVGFKFRSFVYRSAGGVGWESLITLTGVAVLMMSQVAGVVAAGAQQIVGEGNDVNPETALPGYILRGWVRTETLVAERELSGCEVKIVFRQVG